MFVSKKHPRYVKKQQQVKTAKVFFCEKNIQEALMSKLMDIAASGSINDIKPPESPVKTTFIYEHGKIVGAEMNYKYMN